MGSLLGHVTFFGGGLRLVCFVCRHAEVDTAQEGSEQSREQLVFGAAAD